MAGHPLVRAGVSVGVSVRLLDHALERCLHCRAQLVELGSLVALEDGIEILPSAQSLKCGQRVVAAFGGELPPQTLKAPPAHIRYSCYLLRLPRSIAQQLPAHGCRVHAWRWEHPAVAYALALRTSFALRLSFTAQRRLVLERDLVGVDSPSDRSGVKIDVAPSEQLHGAPTMYCLVQASQERIEHQIYFGGLPEQLPTIAVPEQIALWVRLAWSRLKVELIALQK